MVYNFVKSPFKTWIVHELLEAIFHFIVLSLVFQSLTIGVLAGSIHFVIDVYHNYYDKGGSISQLDPQVAYDKCLLASLQYSQF